MYILVVTLVLNFDLILIQNHDTRNRSNLILFSILFIEDLPGELSATWLESEHNTRADSTCHLTDIPNNSQRLHERKSYENVVNFVQK